MSSGTFPALNESSMQRFADDKALTRTRLRAAIKIEGLLEQHKEMFAQLLQTDEAQIAAHTDEWPTPAFTTPRKAPRTIGQHGLLAFPGAYLEGGDTMEEDVSQVRFLIKAAYGGTVFHLRATLNDGAVVWDWRSLEALHEDVKKECLRFLLSCVKSLVSGAIPALLRKIGG